MLSDDAIARYARQVVVPGIGAAGQQKLLDTTALVVGHRRGVDQARLYLEAAGARVTTDVREAADIVVATGVEALSPSERRSLASCGKPVCWYSIDADGFTAGLHPAAPLPFANEPTGEDGLAGRAQPRCEDNPAAGFGDALHDAAACDAAAMACAIAIGLPCRSGPVRFEA